MGVSTDSAAASTEEAPGSAIPQVPRRLEFPGRRVAGAIRRTVTDPSRARDQLEIFADHRRFERRYGPMLRSVKARSDAPATLVVSLSDWPFQLKMEGVLAKALELQGRRAVVLTEPTAGWARRYFRTFGIESLVTPDGYSSPGDATVAARLAREALAETPTVQGLKAVTFNGAHVGIQALSSVSRAFQQGRIDIADSAVRPVLERVLRQAVTSVLVAERLLDDVAPELVMFIERGYAGFGSISDVALDRGLNVIQYGHAGIHWHNALNLKRYTAETRRVHPHSLAASSWATLRDLPWTPERDRALEVEFDLRYGPGEKPPEAGLQTRPLRSPDEVRRQLGLDPGRKVAVVFSHILWDANLFYGDDLFEDQEEWLVETVRAACTNPHLDWIVKLHPANAYKAELGRELNDRVAISEAVGNLPPHVRLLDPEADINTLSLFRVTDVGITIRGTIGMELPCLGVPVLTAGTGRYSGMGFTIDSSSREEYFARLARLHEIEPLSEEEILLAKRHAYALFRLRPLRIESFGNQYMDAERLRTKTLGHNLELTITTPEELRSADDLRRFGEWAVDRSRLDYLVEADEE